MPFTNPIIAGEELIRTGIKSKDFVVGVSGWRISRQGDAEFNNVQIRGTIEATATHALTADAAITADEADLSHAVNGTVDSNDPELQSPNFVTDPDELPVSGWKIDRVGNAYFADVTTRGHASGPIAAYDQISAEELTVGGDDLNVILANKAGGFIYYGRRDLTAAQTVTTTDTNICQINDVPIDGDNRQYKICMQPLGITPGVAGQRVTFTVKWRLSSDGNVVSTDVGGNIAELVFTNSAGCSFQGQRNARFPTGSASPPGTYNFALFVRLTSGATNMSIVSGQAVVFWIEDAGPLVPDTGFFVGTGTGTSTKNFQVNANGSRSYDGGGALFSAANGDEKCYQGQWSSSFGNQKSLIWFPLTVPSGYSGSIGDMNGIASGDIVYLDVYLFFAHWYFIAGGTAIIGWHGNGTVNAGSYNLGGGATNSKQQSWEGRNIGKWVSLKGTAVETAIRNGTFRGIALGPGPTTSLTYYGYCNGAGVTNVPKMRAKYSK